MDIINGAIQGDRIYPFDNVGPYEANSKYFVPGWKFHQISISDRFDDMRFQFFPCFMHQRTYVENVKFTVINSTIDITAKIRPTLYKNVNGIPSRLYADFGAMDVSNDGVKAKAYQRYIDAGPYFIGFLNNSGSVGMYAQHARVTTVSGNLVNEPYCMDQNFYSLSQVSQSTDAGNIYSQHKSIVHTGYANLDYWTNTGAPSEINPSDIYCSAVDFQSGFPILWFEQGNP